MGVKRIWHGWTNPENAAAYQELLHKVIFPGIEAKSLTGLRSIELFRRDQGKEVEFVTIMTFDSLRDVIKFQGKEYEKSYVPEPARKLLKRWDDVAAHYESVEKREPLRF
jgi:hypothetical protein